MAKGQQRPITTITGGSPFCSYRSPGQRRCSPGMPQRSWAVAALAQAVLVYAFLIVVAAGVGAAVWAGRWGRYLRRMAVAPRPAPSVRSVTWCGPLSPAHAAAG